MCSRALLYKIDGSFLFEVVATMAEGDKVGLRQMMPGPFSGIATALTAGAGPVGVLHETGYIGNARRRHPDRCECQRAEGDAERNRSND